MAGVAAQRRGHRLQGTPASLAGVDAWGRLNAAEVPSDHHEGLRERGKWPKLALIAAIRKLTPEAASPCAKNHSGRTPGKHVQASSEITLDYQHRRSCRRWWQTDQI